MFTCRCAGSVGLVSGVLCGARAGDVRCQLVDGHRSAHAAWLGEAQVMHWCEGVLPEYRGTAGTQWFSPPHNATQDRAV